VLALAVDDGGAHRVRQRLERVAQGEHQAVVQRVALGGAGETDDGDGAAVFDAEVGVVGDCGLGECIALLVIGQITKSP
jgi:hypothetical protein